MMHIIAGMLLFALLIWIIYCIGDMVFSWFFPSGNRALKFIFYSYLSASMGLSRDAFRAGYMPETRLIAIPKLMA